MAYSGATAQEIQVRFVGDRSEHTIPSYVSVDRGYFRSHLVLEHHVLRKMGGRVSSEMSKMKPARSHDDGRELGGGTRTAR